MKGTIAVVDDEPDIAHLVSHHLKKAGYKVKEFYNAEEFMNYLSKEKPDLIILDLMLPDFDGFELCKELRKNEKFNDVPIVMLTARSKVEEKVLGLEIGADDYITKPFSPKELVARVNAILRRFRENKDVITAGGILKIDLKKFEVFVKDKKIDLRPAEFKILKLLVQRKGWVFSRRQILEHISGEKLVYERTVDVHIKNLRDKLGEAGKFIKNIRGIGYKFEENG